NVESAFVNKDTITIEIHICFRPSFHPVVSFFTSIVSVSCMWMAVSFKEKFSKFSVRPSIASLTRAEGYSSK
ncbi:hypothetical protein BD408DRAFT_423539, partial [Parasitella parasitica]